MILNLRDKSGRNIVDVEIYITDNKDGKFIEVLSSVLIEPYSLKLIELIKHDVEKVKIFVISMSTLSELRGWFWEIYCEKKGNRNRFGTYKEAELFKTKITNEIKKMFKEASDAFDLIINID